MHCTLFIPDLFSMERGPPANRLAAAETLIARGRRTRKPAISPESWLFERFGAPRERDRPVAPYTLLADGGTPGTDFWMRADPVHLSVGHHSLALDGAALDVSRAEADALTGTLNAHFGDALPFHAPKPDRWYVKIPRPELQTTPPYEARGVAVGDGLPTGADSMRYRALMNEVQMLLHEHPVNTEREARGAPAANSVWFWGGGTLEALRARRFSIVLADDPLARGLALATGIAERNVPGNAVSALAALPAEGLALIVLRSLASDRLERDWFKPLLAALETGRIGMLSLCLAGETSRLETETVRSDLRYFWRTRKPLASFFA